MHDFQIADSVRVMHTDPMRERGIAGIRGVVIEVLGADRGGIARLMIKSRDGKYHQVTAAAVQLRRGR
jgi:hypothetical protein